MKIKHSYGRIFVTTLILIFISFLFVAHKAYGEPPPTSSGIDVGGLLIGSIPGAPTNSGNNPGNTPTNPPGNSTGSTTPGMQVVWQQYEQDEDTLSYKCVSPETLQCEPDDTDTLTNNIESIKPLLLIGFTSKLFPFIPIITTYSFVSETPYFADRYGIAKTFTETLFGPQNIGEIIKKSYSDPESSNLISTDVVKITQAPGFSVRSQDYPLGLVTNGLSSSKTEEGVLESYKIGAGQTQIGVTITGGLPNHEYLLPLNYGARTWRLENASDAPSGQPDDWDPKGIIMSDSKIPCAIIGINGKYNADDSNSSKFVLIPTTQAGTCLVDVPVITLSSGVGESIVVPSIPPNTNAYFYPDYESQLPIDNGPAPISASNSGASNHSLFTACSNPPSGSISDLDEMFCSNNNNTYSLPIQPIQPSLLNIPLGTKSNDVSELQSDLVGTGYLPSSDETGFYGSDTQLAVENYETGMENYILNTSGTFLDTALTPVSTVGQNTPITPSTQGEQAVPQTSTPVVPYTTTPIVPNVTLTADQDIVTLGQTVKLTWTSSNALSCYGNTSVGNTTNIGAMAVGAITNMQSAWGGSIPLNGYAIVKPVNSITSYSITCNGQGGTTATQSLSVKIVSSSTSGSSGGSYQSVPVQTPAPVVPATSGSVTPSTENSLSVFSHADSYLMASVLRTISWIFGR